MPAQYEAIKRSEMKSGKPKKEAERIAAATYNKNRPNGATPMGPNYEARAAKHKLSGAAHRSRLHKKVRAGLKAAFPD